MHLIFRHLVGEVLQWEGAGGQLRIAREVRRRTRRDIHLGGDGKEHEQRFRETIARGLTSEDAGIAADVSSAVGVRWFPNSSGVNPLSGETPASERYLSFAEPRKDCHAPRQKLRGPGNCTAVAAIAVDDLAGTAPQRGDRSGQMTCPATKAQWYADRRARRPKSAKLVKNDKPGSTSQTGWPETSPHLTRDSSPSSAPNSPELVAHDHACPAMPGESTPARLTGSAGSMCSSQQPCSVGTSIEETRRSVARHRPESRYTWRNALMLSRCRARLSWSRTPRPSSGARHSTPTLPWCALRCTSSAAWPVSSSA